MVEMTIESIRVSLTNYQRVVILKEKESDRFLPIWIGPAEAANLYCRGVSWWREQATEGNLDAELNGPNGSYTFTASAAAALAKAKNIARRR